MCEAAVWCGVAAVVHTSGAGGVCAIYRGGVAVLAAVLVILRVCCANIACCVRGAVPLPTVNQKKVCFRYPCDAFLCGSVLLSASKQKAHSSISLSPLLPSAGLQNR